MPRCRESFAFFSLDTQVSKTQRYVSVATSNTKKFGLSLQLNGPLRIHRLGKFLTVRIVWYEENPKGKFYFDIKIRDSNGQGWIG